MQNSNKTTLTFIADTHHYSETLGTSGEAYERRSGTDQKCLRETGAIIDAALEEIKGINPDALMIIGDISDDGEKASHLEMIEKLNKFSEKIPVCVTLATHDWCCDGNARRYVGDRVYHDVETVTSEELHEMYFNFGPNRAKEEYITHLGTSSYIVELPNDVVLFSLIDDQDGEGNSGFMPEHLEWITDRIKKEADSGKLVIGMEHHLLYPHISPLITDNGTCCKKHEMYIEKFAEAGMRFLFVGHSHIQRIDKYVSPTGKELYEINVGSLVGYPAPIVTLTADDDTVKIETRKLSGFTYNGEKYTSRYFEIHAQNLVGRILSSAKSSDKEFYIKDMREYGMGRKTALKMRPVLKALACTADKMTVKTLGKIINAVTLGTTFSNSDLDELADKRIIDIVNEQILSVLDGACVKHPEGSAYYNAVTGFVGLPDRAVKRLKIKDEKINRLTSSLNTAIREILTGGDLDNETLTVKR